MLVMDRLTLLSLRAWSDHATFDRLTLEHFEGRKSHGVGLDLTCVPWRDLAMRRYSVQNSDVARGVIVWKDPLFRGSALCAYGVKANVLGALRGFIFTPMLRERNSGLTDTTLP